MSSDDEIYRAEPSVGDTQRQAETASPFGPESGRGMEPARGMQYGHLVSYIFKHPQWGMNLLLGTVCQFIPLIGNILLIGYQFEIVATLQQGNPQYPEFNFDRFVPYLYRGLWPFLVNLTISIILMPIAVLAMVGFLVVGDKMDLDDGPKILLIVVPAVCLTLLVSLLVTLFAIPMTLGAGLTQTFAWGVRPNFIFGFVRRVWPEILLGTAFLLLAGMVLTVLGMLLCFVGLYPAVTVMMLAQAQLYFQLYRLYLARGGEPLPLAAPA